jgi:hypothetical protein
MDDVGEQATGARTALTIIIAQKNFYVPSEEVFPSNARSLQTNIALCFFFNFPAPSRRETAVLFFSEKSPLGFRDAFFYSFSREEFSAARSDPIVFLFGTCGPSGAEGRA